MSDKKIYKKLPVVHQTAVIKNFFESTVEQLFSKSNTEIVQGYIGSRTSDDVNLSGQYLPEPTVTKRFYGLSPTINTINSDTGESENLIFYDELIDTLKTYGVDTKNHNKIFSEQYSAFLPPVNPDKLLNYSEYYWYPQGPTAIQVTGTADNPIDVTQDIIGKTQYTPPGGKKFRNGMVIKFAGEFVIPQSLTVINYVVTGVGDSIQLIPQKDNFSTRFTDLTESEYDYYENDLTDAKHSASTVDTLSISSAGAGYVEPKVLVYDNVYVPESDPDYANLAVAYPEAIVTYTNELEANVNTLSLQKAVEANTNEYSLSDHSNVIGIINAFSRKFIDDTGALQNAELATVTVTLDDDSGIQANVTGSGSGYTGSPQLLVFDQAVNTTANVSAMVTEYGANAFVTDTLIVESLEDVKVGQEVNGYNFNAVVTEVIAIDVPQGINHAQVVLDRSLEFTSTAFSANAALSFNGVGFSASVRLSNAVYGDGTVNIQTTQAKVGINPNSPADYYFTGGNRSFDSDLNDDGTGDVFWGGTVASGDPDYILQEKGAVNKNVWSRVNFWYHRDNFLDAGDNLPNRSHRAVRPILEFSRHLELYNHAKTTAGTVTAAVTDYMLDEIQGQKPGFTVDNVPLEGATFILTSETPDLNNFIYTAKLDIDTRTISVTRAGDPVLNPPNVVDGENGFIPFEIQTDQSVQILSGEKNIGKEFIYNGTEWVLGQEKTKINQAPLFNLYDDSGTVLDDINKYPNSTFSGNKLFGYAVNARAGTTLSSTDDPVLQFPLVYKQYKSSSEIVYDNYQDIDNYTFTPTNGSPQTIEGYKFYKDLKNNQFLSVWRNAEQPSVQRIYTTYTLTQMDIDLARVRFSIGCVPDRNVNLNSGYDIKVKINGKNFENFVYSTSDKPGFIEFTGGSISANDFIEISAGSETGLISLNSNSKYELPIGWGHNIFNTDVEQTTEPEFLTHFSKYMEAQPGFQGEPLGSNNFDNTAKTPDYAKDIVHLNQDTVLGAYLLDDQPHNLVDALRFCSHEYVKYKNRLRNELTKLYSSDYDLNSNAEGMLETTLRNLISFKVGEDVFNRTYIVPFGDNYEQEEFVAALDQKLFVLNKQADLDLIENSVLVYLNDKLLCVDRDYVISDFTPITINVLTELNAGDKLVVKIYDAERDSAQCPPTPSTMGITPLFQPEIVYDNTFQEPVQVLIGHDGSHTPVYGDFRDDVLLDFETRIYNAAKGEFREKNSLLDYSMVNVRQGAFRNNSFAYTEWYDLLRHNFSVWSNINPVNSVVNEFYDDDNEWTWNYGDDNFPGHWKGVYEFYYDTDKPHTHPWEMLGFTEKPLWWETQYGTDYGANNSTLWEDLEQGIIRQGPRANIQHEKYLTNNPYRRVGLKNVIPVTENSELISPYRLFDTGTTTRRINWTNTDTTNHDSYKTASFLNIDGVNVSHDSSNVYVKSRAIVNHNIPSELNKLTTHTSLYGDPLQEQDVSYVLPKVNLNTVARNPSPMAKAGAVAVAVNGLPIYATDYGISWNGEGVWYEDRVKFERVRDHEYEADNNGLFHYHTITPGVIGLTEWNTETHSPIVGWAFDGLPIYGPYGYEDPEDTQSNIVKIKSPWVVREGNRTSGPGGAHTGKYIQDYRLEATLESINGYVDRYNVRYGFTPDSPTTKIRHYVVTLDSDNNPAFPYHVGGGTTNVDHWAGDYYAPSSALGRIGNIEVVDPGGLYTTATVTITGDGTHATADAVITDGKITGITITNPGKNYSTASATISGDGVRAKLKVNLSDVDNSQNAAVFDTTATPAYVSVSNLALDITGDISKPWKFGDTSPVEYAWKKSEGFTFAESEALLLAKPGRFANVFSDPTNLYRPEIGGFLLSLADKKKWKFYDPAHFRVHGDKTPSGKFITNVGYTQFINSWLKLQGLDTSLDFVPQMRTLNMKLAHRMNGYVDKDTMTVRTDQYSNQGDATSLIIPKENIDVLIHSSNYKNRHFYTGVLIEKTASGYRVRGYDRTRTYFNIIESQKVGGRRERVSVGGEAVSFVQWEPNQTYPKGIIVKVKEEFYQAETKISGGSTFDKTGWNKLPSLPQVNGASATLYQDTTGNILRVNYDTEYTTEEDLYDFLISLGRYQEQDGYDFGNFDTQIGEVRNWQYAAKQFLFWSTGKWEIGNTLMLSPLANKVTFELPRGFIAKINRNEREQFCLIDQEGSVVSPQECEIVREDNKIQITPPQGSQIYGTMLFSKEIEHALVIDNKTSFNDTIFDPLLYQKHSRVKIKTTRTKNWTGQLFTQGFIVNNDELLPNLDNLAETMGRYSEIGFVPVEKEIYEASRAQYGYTQKAYLRDLDIVDEQQFDFYRGMVQSKGTSQSLSRIARSNAIVQGNVTVYDEWAIKAGDFGDLNNNQSVELKLNKSDVVQEPQLITTRTPVDITYGVSRVDVLDARFTYFKQPKLEISKPQELDGTQATATVNLNSSGKIETVTVTNTGSGYSTDSACAFVIAAELKSDENSTQLSKAVASIDSGNSFINVNKTSASVSLEDHIGDSGNVTILVDTAPANITVSDIVDAINSNAVLNVNIVAKEISSHEGNVTGSHILLSGSDFSVTDGANINVAEGRYQPKQRLPLVATVYTDDYNTTIEDVKVLVDGTVVPNQTLDANGAVTATNWTYNPGNVNTVTTTVNYPTIDTSTPRSSDSDVFPTANNSVTFALSEPIHADNIILNEEGLYEFVEVYINDVRVTNLNDSERLPVVSTYANLPTLSNVLGQAYVVRDTLRIYLAQNLNGTDVWTHVGNVLSDDIQSEDSSFITFKWRSTRFTLTTNSITFPDINNLPDSVLTSYVNPPQGYNKTGQRELVKGIASGSKIRIVERSAVDFDISYQGDLPGKTVTAQILVKDGLTVRIGPSRTFEITPDLKSDKVVTIDIDDANRFIKKPTNPVGYNLWPTTTNVDYTGITDPAYTKIPNAGYVHPGDVKYRAFDLGSLPDLFTDNVTIKPEQGDLIHIANSENSDWNVYRLEDTNASTEFLYREEGGNVTLYTDYSLFNYLDTNQIGEENTGRYLDYFLTVNNATVSDKVLVWTNENIIQNKQTTITAFDAPQMVEARIASIGPRNLTPISNVEPISGRVYSGLEIIDVNELNDQIVIRGNNFNDVEVGDTIRLMDRAGIAANYPANLTASGNIMTFSVRGVGNVEVTNSGSGYQVVPTVTFSEPYSGSTIDTAKGTVSILGNVSSITVVDDGTIQSPAPEVDIAPPTSGNTATATGEITGAQLVGFEIIDSGSDYAKDAQNIVVTITGANTTPAVARAHSDADGRIDFIDLQDRGAGYSESDIQITVGSSGNPAVVIPILRGNLDITVTDSGDGYTEVPEVSVSTANVTSTTAILDAEITGVNILNPGSAYTGTATISVTGANSSPATFSVNMQSGVEELNTRFTAEGAGNVFISLDADLQSRFTYLQDSVLTEQERATAANISALFGKSHAVQSVNPSNGTFTIQNDAVADVTILGNATIEPNVFGSSYTVSVFDNYDDRDYVVQDRSPTTITIERPNSVNSFAVSLRHYNQSKITAPNHGLSVGDVVRLKTNQISGMFRVESASQNSFVVPAKYVAGFTDGELVGEGLEIKTVGNHGISPLYVASGKRVAVHFAEPLYYNKVYPVSSVTADRLFIDDFWPRDARTHVFYESKTKFLNASIPYEAGNVQADFANATNTIAVTDNIRLSDHVVQYTSNSDIISSAFLTWHGNYLEVSASALPGNTSISTEISVQRQMLRENGRYAMLTTIDHDKVVLNGSQIRVPSYNNAKGMTMGINREMEKRRQFTNTDRNGGFGLRFGMLKNPNTAVFEDYSATEISDYGPYLRDKGLINLLSGGELEATDEMSIGNKQEEIVDPKFTKPNKQVGPHKGLMYTDLETGIVYVWNPRLQKYVIITDSEVDASTLWENPEEPPKPPEYHRYSAETGATENDPQDVLLQIPGSATGSISTDPGVAQPVYDMTANVTYNTSAHGNVEIVKYRLSPNNYNIYEVYEGVQNSDEDIYYVLVDRVNPPSVQHDFFATVNAYDDFGNASITNYYYDNSITPSFNGSNQITNADDPIRLQNTGYVLSMIDVEPAAYVGLQIVPEPFAVSGGNGTDAQQNILGAPQMILEAPDLNSDTVISVEQPGYDSFLLWTAGLTPGEWIPKPEGPGRLPGYNDTPSNLGFGRGYYEAGQNDFPSDYPNTAGLTYDKPIQRLAYSRNQSVFPQARNYTFTMWEADDGTRFTEEQYQAAVDAGENSIGPYLLADLTQITIDPEFVLPGDTSGKMIAENVFVACFWTEPHTYENQLVGLDFTNLYADGTPKEIIGDYEGTVVRFKYIRLTELPRNAITRRLIPDTGWSGKQWTNRRVDTVTLPFTPENADSIWELFDPATYESGSTGGTDGTISINIGNRGTTTQPTDSGTTITNDGTLIVGDDFQNDDLVPTTPIGPILTGSVFDGLPGPCVPPDDPSKGTFPSAGGSSNCADVDVVTKYEGLGAADINSGANDGDITLGNYKDTSGTVQTVDTWAYKTVKIAGEGPVTLMFNTVNGIPGVASTGYTAVDTALGFIVMQSTEEFPNNATPEDQENWVANATSILFRTKHSGGDPSSNGNQIGYYGFQTINQNTGENRDTFAEEQMGLAEDHPWFTHVPNPASDQSYWNSSMLTNLTPDDTLPFANVFKNSGAWNEMIVQGIGFGTSYNVDCRAGEYITVFIFSDAGAGVKDIGGNDRNWRALIKYQTEKIIILPPDDGGDDSGGADDTCEYENAGSREYQQGLLIKEWQGNNSYAYFGQMDDDGEYDKGATRNNVDNIYFDHSTPGTVKTWHPEKSGVLSGNYLPIQNSAKYHRLITSGKYFKTFSSWNFNLDAYSRTYRTLVGKGYWLCPADGLYELEGYSDDGLHVWVSSAWGGFRTTAYGQQYAHRIGVNDMGLITKWTSEQGPIAYADGQDVGEYYKEDKPLDVSTITAETFGGVSRTVYAKGGNSNYNNKSGYGNYLTYEANNSYMDSKFYHVHNSLLRTGWLTTNHTSSSQSQVGIDYPRRARANPFSSRVMVELKGGEYYFVRLIAGNNKGPGYGRFRWRNKTNGTSGVMQFGGRFCPEDNPSEVDNGGGNGGTDSGGNGGGSNGGGTYQEDGVADTFQEQTTGIGSNNNTQTAAQQKKARYESCLETKGVSDPTQQLTLGGGGTYDEADIPGLACYYSVYEGFPSGVNDQLKEQVLDSMGLTNDDVPPEGTVLEEGCETTMSFAKNSLGQNKYAYTGKYFYRIADGTGGYDRILEDSGSRCPSAGTFVGEEDQEQTQTDNSGGSTGSTGSGGSTSGGGSTGSGGSTSGGGGSSSTVPAAGTIISQACEVKFVNVFGNSVPINSGIQIQTIADGKGGTYTTRITDTTSCPVGVNTSSSGGGGYNNPNTQLK